MTRTRSARRRVAVGTLAAGAALMAFGWLAPSAQAAGPAVFGPGYDSYLNDNQRGLTAAEMDNGEACPEDPKVEGMTAWHFVLSANTHDFASLDVAFHLGTLDVTMLGLTPKTTADWATFDPTKNFIASPTGKHAYVYTPVSGTLRDAASQDAPDSTGPKFQLSHTCVGDGAGTDGSTSGGSDYTTDGATTDGSTDYSTDGTTTDGTTTDGTTTDGTTTDGTTTDGTTTDGTTTDGTTTDGTTTDGTTTDGVLSTDGVTDQGTTTDGATTGGEQPPVTVEGSVTLPRTGAEDHSLVFLGGALILAGGIALLMSREASSRS